MDRKLTTIFIADAVGFSRLAALDEDDAITRLRRIMVGLITPQIQAADGRVIKTLGDGVLAEFSSPVGAVRAAIEIQTQVDATETGPEDRRLVFRIGIHLGDVVINGDDLLGDGVNVAARLEALAAPGGICVSRTVHDQLHGKISQPLSPLGPQKIKNIPEPVDVWMIGGRRAAVAEVDAPAPTERPSIAVLPFQNMSSDPDQDFLADGIVEDVITELSRFRALFVIARNSTFAYRDNPVDVRQIAKDLNARYVVEGSVRRAGDRLRLTVQLIDAKTGAHVWADRFDRRMDDLFDLQDALTQAIVTGVEPELGANERAQARLKPPGNLTAWELYQRAWTEFLSSGSPESVQRTLEMCQRSIAADPGFSLPRALYARATFSAIARGHPGAEAHHAAALEHTETAVRLDDRCELSWVALGTMHVLAGRDGDALAALDKGLALNPNNGFLRATIALAEIYMAAPDPDRMEQNAKAALDHDPKAMTIWGMHVILGHAEIIRHGDWANENARLCYERAAAYPTTDFISPMYAALCNMAAGRNDEALGFLDRARSLRPDLTIEMYRNHVSFPIWSTFRDQFEPFLQDLANLGLPRS